MRPGGRCGLSVDPTPEMLGIVTSSSNTLNEYRQKKKKTRLLGHYMLQHLSGVGSTDKLTAWLVVTVGADSGGTW